MNYATLRRAAFLVLDVAVNPADHEVRELIAVSVLHQHVAVSLDAEGRQIHHLGIPARLLELIDEGVAAGQRIRPAERSLHVPEMVAEHDQRRDLGKRRKLRGRQRGIAAYFNRDDSPYSGRIDQCGLFREEAGLRVSDEDGAMQLY